jgi:arginyl-tRNA synthetase
LAEKKVNDFGLDSSYYVVGSDQEYHFNVLFTILGKLGLRKDWRHLSYGMVSLPEGKMKSREGTALSADDLIEETRVLAEEGIKSRLSGKMDGDEIYSRSMKIALAAIKYTLLKVDIHRGIVFNPESSLSFEGDTGPYLLYSYARANSILGKVDRDSVVNIFDMKSEESRLLKKVNSFEEVLEKSYRQMAPNLIANYCFELSQIFNEFYHACPVVGSKEEGFRIKLVNAFKITLGKALELLGIETLEEM